MGSTDVGRRPTTSECRQGAGTSEVGGRKPVGFRPDQEVSCHGMTGTCFLVEHKSKSDWVEFSASELLAT